MRTDGDGPYRRASCAMCDVTQWRRSTVCSSSGWWRATRAGRSSRWWSPARPAARSPRTWCPWPTATWWTSRPPRWASTGWAWRWAASRCAGPAAARSASRARRPATRARWRPAGPGWPAARSAGRPSSRSTRSARARAAWASRWRARARRPSTAATTATARAPSRTCPRRPATTSSTSRSTTARSPVRRSTPSSAARRRCRPASTSRPPATVCWPTVKRPRPERRVVSWPPAVSCVRVVFAGFIIFFIYGFSFVCFVLFFVFVFVFVFFSGRRFVDPTRADPAPKIDRKSTGKLRKFRFVAVFAMFSTANRGVSFSFISHLQQQGCATLSY